jgi:hypothetical protein
MNVAVTGLLVDGRSELRKSPVTESSYFQTAFAFGCAVFFIALQVRRLRADTV